MFLLYKKDKIPSFCQGTTSTSDIDNSHTLCPRSSDPFYIVTYHIKWVTTSWTHSTNNIWLLCFLLHASKVEMGKFFFHFKMEKRGKTRSTFNFSFKKFLMYSNTFYTPIRNVPQLELVYHVFTLFPRSLDAIYIVSYNNNGSRFLRIM